MSGMKRRDVLGLGAGAAPAAPFLMPAFASDAADPVARPPAGALRGTARDGILAFPGIPYAAAATRFRSPRPAAPWPGVRDALRQGPASIQTIPPWAAWLYDKPAAMDEDCLTLKVWTPGLDGRRPVLVWIHGGA